VVLALTLTGDVDPGTAALAILTLVSLLFGWRALRQTQSEIDLSRREVEEAHRPVVVPFIDIADRFHLVAGQGPVAAGPQLRPGGLRIAVKNIGSGPALDVEVAVTARDGAGGVLPDWGDEKHVGVIAGIGVPRLFSSTWTFQSWLARCQRSTSGSRTPMSPRRSGSRSRGTSARAKGMRRSRLTRSWRVRTDYGIATRFNPCPRPRGAVG
jgi:hypothetical protein